MALCVRTKLFVGSLEIVTMRDDATPPPTIIIDFSTGEKKLVAGKRKMVLWKRIFWLIIISISLIIAWDEWVA